MALEVSVKPDAPSSEGPLTKAKYSWWRAIAEEHFQVNKTSQTNRKQFAAPSVVPILDASGEGLLDLSRASIFLKAHYRIVKSAKIKPHEFLPFELFQPHANIFLEESHLSPSEPLFILGQVTQLNANHQDDAIYRDTANTPTIGGSEAQLIVCAGSRASLASLLRRRFLALEIVMVIAGVLCVSLFGTMLWFVSL